MSSIRSILLHKHADVPFRTVWSLCNLTLDGKLILREDRNVAFVQYMFSISCHCQQEWNTSRISNRQSLIG